MPMSLPIKTNAVSVTENLRDDLNQSLLGRELLSILSTRNLSPVFQPIIDVKKRQVFAFEALIRGPENSPLFNPLSLFNAAEEHGCLFEMDWLARQISIERFQYYGSQEYLFLNVTVNALMQGAHQSGVTLDCLKVMGISLENVVIEITELQPVEDFTLFVESINHYREMGFKVAIDDLGGGYNGLRIWSEVKPDFVKIDKHFVDGIVDDVDKRRFMETICALAKGLNTKIVAEGVEDEATLKVLEKIGVDYIQGFLFKKPQPVPSAILDYQWPMQALPLDLRLEESLECLLMPCHSFHPEQEVGVLSDYLLKETQVDFVPVVANKHVLGIVWRRDLMDMLARRFGRDLTHRKSVGNIMDSDPVVVDISMSLVELSRLITGCQSGHRGDAFIITENGDYKGCARFMDLLRVMTDLKMKSAQYANPLSGLPGNVPIQNTIQGLLEQQCDFVVIYIDIDNFKPYNDYYSFEQGDDVLRGMSDLLKSHVVGGDDFIGHIGGDDFIIVTTRVVDYESICNGILKEFRQQIGQYYLPKDREQGGILSVNREGSEEFYPLMSLSLGVLLISAGVFNHQQKLASCATMAKKKAKLMGGDTLAVIDSRDFVATMACDVESGLSIN